MKKFFSLLCTLLMYISACAYTTEVSSDLRIWLEVPETFVADGKTVNYVKVFQHDDKNIDYTAFNMEIIVPEGFTVNKVKQGREMVNDIFLSERGTSSHGIYCNLVDGVDLRIISDSGNNDNFYTDTENGEPLDELFTVGLLVSPDVADGSYTLQCKGIKFVIKTGDACVPANEPIDVEIKVANTTDIDAVNATVNNEDELYDVRGIKISSSDTKGRVVISRGKKRRM